MLFCVAQPQCVTVSMSADSVVFTRGFVALTGPGVTAAAEEAAVSADLPTIARERSGPEHVTLFTKEELRELRGSGRLDERLWSCCDTRFVCLGVGKSGQVAWAVVVWPGGSLLRKQHGFSERKEFHVTLTNQDSHEARKDVASLAVTRQLSSEEVALVLEDVHAAHDAELLAH